MTTLARRRLPSRCRVAVVGGGITGLAAAHELFAKDFVAAADLVVLEADDRLGGLIRTVREGPYLFEGGPDTMVTQKPAGLELCRRLGMEQEIVHPYDAVNSTVHVMHRGELFPVPEEFRLIGPARLGPLLRSRLFGPADKLRMMAERFLPPAPAPDGDESLRSFVTRRFGRAAFERVAEPIAGGLFTADADRLSMQMNLPRVLELERSWGSVARAMSALHASREGARGGPALVAFRGGMQTLVERLVERLTRVTLATGRRVERLDRTPTGAWRLTVGGGKSIVADAVVLACPGFAAAKLLRGVAPEVADAVGSVEYASCATINLVYERDAVGGLPDGFGFFVPRTEGASVLACSHVSRKFPDRAPSRDVVLRAYLGGALHDEVLKLDDDELVDTAHAFLAPVLKLRGGPKLARLYRYPDAMPQYPVGDRKRVVGLRERLADHDGLFLCGGGIDSIGLPDCIRSGHQASEMAYEYLERSQRSTAAECGAPLSRQLLE